MIELIVLGWILWKASDGLSSSSGGSSGSSKGASPKAKAPVAAAKRESLAAQWRATPVKKGSPTNRAGAVTGKAAAYLTRAGLGHMKAFTEGWGASWKEAAAALWERNDEPGPEDEEEEEEAPEPDPPTPPRPTPPEKPTGGKAPAAPPEKPTVAAPPVRKPAPAPAPARDTGLPPASYPYPPTKPLRLVQPDERKPPTMSVLTGEATNFDSAREQLAAVADTAMADLEICTGDATRSGNRANALDALAAGMAALKVDPETVRDAHAVAEASIAFAQAQEAARAAAELVYATAKAAQENLQARYGNLVEAAAAAPAIPNAEFITSH